MDDGEQALMEKKEIILKKQVNQLMLRDNQAGLSRNENATLRRLIKEWHEVNYRLDAR